MIQYKTNYDKWAKYYDLIYEITPPDDSKIYKKYIKNSKSVLEMGIGTGRILLDFIQYNIEFENY